MFKGVIFDMDGVLIDSEEFIRKAAVRYFAELGVTVQEEDFIPFVGKGENRYLGGVAEKYGVELDIEPAKTRLYRIYFELIEGNAGPLPGVHEFIGKCKENGWRIAVATSADKPKMVGNLREIGLPEPTFDALVNGNDIERKKPFPDIFLLAAERMGLPAADCLVVEDAPAGVEAAKAAGSRCLALTTSFSKEELAGADWWAKNLEDALPIFFRPDTDKTQ